MCDPPQGHARAAEACAELKKAEGDIGAIPQKKNVFCPMVYAPVTVRARGEWHGRPVDFRETFSNACAMGARTGAVFALDG
ncbi:SSI family serine proteinase inhibitor [Streptomyces sp. NPDC004542]|uniref:SSI family serine proteinase inhibitor n=1 Tax=Streptomyces sp. NPDC004542 TaxID=3154281 RepID=UPI0033A77651